MRHPKTPDQLAAERQDADRLAALLWPEGWRCPSCGCERHGRIASRPRVFQCARCGTQRSVTSGTQLERTRSIRRWFEAAERMTRPRGCAASRLAAEEECGWEAAWETMQRLRAAIPVPTDEQLGEKLQFWSWGVLVRKPPGVGRKHYDEPWCRAAVMILKGDGERYKFEAWGEQQRMRKLVASGRLEPRRHAPLGIVLGKMDLWLRKTHRTVSHRWLLRYSREFAERRRGATADELVGYALVAGPSRFERTKPPFKGDLRRLPMAIFEALGGRCPWYRPRAAAAGGSTAPPPLGPRGIR